MKRQRSGQLYNYVKNHFRIITGKSTMLSPNIKFTQIENQGLITFKGSEPSLIPIEINSSIHLYQEETGKLVKSCFPMIKQKTSPLASAALNTRAYGTHFPEESTKIFNRMELTFQSNRIKGDKRS